MSKEIQDTADRRLIADLRAGLDEAEPRPPDVDEFARAAFALRNVDAELAKLAYDSTESGALDHMRSTAAARMITFETGRWSIDVEYHQEERQLSGQVTPTEEAEVELRLVGSSRSTETDELGRFHFDDISPGPVSVVIRAGGDTITTEWTVL